MNGLRKLAGVRLFDIVVRPVAWLYRVLTLRIIVVGALSAAALFGIYKVDTWVWLEGRPILRDLAITVAADKLAGDPIMLKVCDRMFAVGREDCDLIYSRSAPLYPATQWGLVVNSPYLTEEVTRIVPFFTYEGVTAEPYVPQVLYFYPLIDDMSFHWGGRTDCVSSVMLNERYLTFEAWNDARDIRSTLTHELIHNQLGNFCGYPVPPPDRGNPVTVQAWIQARSVWVEQHTESATIEVLAAQCRYADELGCAAFWDSVAALSRGSLYTRLNRAGLSFLYDPLLNVLTRDRQESKRAEKAFRYWAGQGPAGIRARDLIIEKYQAGPWESYVLPGVLWGIPLDTGNTGYRYIRDGEAIIVVLGMKFDDTGIMFGPLGRGLLWALTP